MRSLVLMPLARADLIGIGDYLVGVAGPGMAAKVVGDLHSAMRQLADGTATGHVRADLTPRPVLFYLVGSYYVIHRDDPAGPMEVIRILHSARDVPILLT